MSPEPTPTPWVVYLGRKVVANQHHAGMHGALQDPVAECERDADAALIVSAVNERAALLAERAELQFKLAHKVSEVDRLMAERAELTRTLTELLADHSAQAHGRGAPGHIERIKAARALLARLGKGE